MPRGGLSALTDPVLDNRVCGAVPQVVDGYDYWLTGRSVRAGADFHKQRRRPARLRPLASNANAKVAKQSPMALTVS